MKKRMIAALMATALAVSALAGCSSKPAESAAAPAETTAAATEAATEAAKEDSATEAATEAAAQAAASGEGSDYHLAICIHSMDNEYWQRHPMVYRQMSLPVTAMTTSSCRESRITLHSTATRPSL